MTKINEKIKSWKSEAPTGTTEGAHEVRHLASKMQLVRDGKMSEEELQDYLQKLRNEHDILITRCKDCLTELGDRSRRVIQYKVPRLTVKDAAGYVYSSGYEATDFDYVKRVALRNQYSDLPAPNKEHVEISTMMLMGAIYDLAWAIGEVEAHLGIEYEKRDYALDREANSKVIAVWWQDIDAEPWDLEDIFVNRLAVSMLEVRNGNFCSEAVKEYFGDLEKQREKLIEYFEKCLQLASNDVAANCMLKRCIDFANNPPCDWDGATSLTTK